MTHSLSPADDISVGNDQRSIDRKLLDVASDLESWADLLIELDLGAADLEVAVRFIGELSTRQLQILAVQLILDSDDVTVSHRVIARELGLGPAGYATVTTQLRRMAEKLDTARADEDTSVNRDGRLAQTSTSVDRMGSDNDPLSSSTPSRARPKTFSARRDLPALVNALDDALSTRPSIRPTSKNRTSLHAFEPRPSYMTQ